MQDPFAGFLFTHPIVKYLHEFS